MIVSISQPMFLPWSGLFEQIMLSDVFIHYDDVQRAQGRSFINRVQLKNHQGSMWITAPIDKNNSGKIINDTYYLEDQSWRSKHLKKLENLYSKSLFKSQMLELAYQVYSYNSDSMSLFNINAIETISNWLEINTVFLKSSELNVPGKSSKRLLDLCLSIQATEYVTGHGALNYLDTTIFDAHDIDVSLMEYSCTPYKQLYGEFTPYVTIFDMIANCGKDSIKYIQPSRSNFENYKSSMHIE